MNSLDVIRKYRSLKEDILYPFDEEVEKKFKYEGTISKIKDSREKLANLSQKVDILSKTEFQEHKNALALTIHSMIDVFHAGVDDLEPSLDQGKVIPHEIFNVIIRELSYALKTGYHSIPSLFYTREKQKQLDYSRLEILLKRWESIFKTKDYVLFQELEDDFEIMKSNIIDLYKSTYL